MSLSALFNNHTVTTTNGQKFTGEESAKLYALIHKRFGYDRVRTAQAVARLMEYKGTPTEPSYVDQVIELANYGRTLLKGNA